MGTGNSSLYYKWHINKEPPFNINILQTIAFHTFMVLYQQLQLTIIQQTKFWYKHTIYIYIYIYISTCTSILITIRIF
jgi:hypothetical protein